MRYWVILLITAAPLALGADNYEKVLKEYKNEIKNKSSDIKDIQKEIDRKKSEIKEYEKKENNLKAELEEIDSKANKISSDLKKTHRELSSTDENLRETEEKLKACGENIKEDRNKLAAELDYLYRRHYSINRFLDDPFTERLRVYNIKDRVSCIKLTKEEKENAEKKNNELYNKRIQLSALDKKLSEQKSSTTEELKSKKTSLKEITQMRSLTGKEIKKLNSTMQEMQDFIKKIEEDRKKVQVLKKQEEMTKKKFKEKEGNLPWPVKGEIISCYGKIKDPVSGNIIINNGIRILPALQGDICCIDKGEVVYAQKFRSYGNTVIVSHGGGVYTIYGQLNKIFVKEDDKLRQGQVIGSSSNSEGIYFEIRIDGEPDDPVKWLSK